MEQHMSQWIQWWVGRPSNCFHCSTPCISVFVQIIMIPPSCIHISLESSHLVLNGLCRHAILLAWHHRRSIWFNSVGERRNRGGQIDRRCGRAHVREPFPARARVLTSRLVWELWVLQCSVSATSLLVWVVLSPFRNIRCFVLALWS
jgi:hypothetical protein